MAKPSTTVVVVPRETHSAWPSMLATLRANTAPTVPVVVVDGGAPPRIRRHLEEFARAHDVTLVRADHLLSSNEARNAGLRHVHTDFVVFIDNDSLVPAGWLPALEACAHETGAALVAPVILSQRRGNWVVHAGGGTTGVAGDGPTRHFDERMARMGEPADAVAGLPRELATFVELHCLLVRRAALDEIGGFDEGYLAGREHSDLTLQVAARGGRGWLEPAVVVRYPRARIRRASDWAFFLPRWSHEWATASFAHFNRKWQLEETSIDDWYLRGTLDRRLHCRARPERRWPRAVWRQERRARRAIDKVLTPALIARNDRRRAGGAATRVVRRASWDRTEQDHPADPTPAREA